MSSHKNRVKMTVSGTPGTGTITLSAASSGYQSFATAYGADATVDILITEGASWEIARDCAYTNSGTTVTRGTLEASSTGSAVSFTSAAVVSVIATAEKGTRLETALQAVTPGGRLTLETGVPVSTTDQTAKTSIYYTPYIHNVVPLWDGTNWVPTTFTEKTLALGTLTSGKPYDVFGYLSSGALVLESLVWTDDTTRATAVTLQDGRYCKSGDKTRLLLGTFYTTSTTTTEDSKTSRYLSNAYNREARQMRVTDATASWTYNTATWRSANNSTANRFRVVSCLSAPLYLMVLQRAYTSATGIGAWISIGKDSTSTPSASATQGALTGTDVITMSCAFSESQAPGFSYYQWIEKGHGSGTSTFISDSAAFLFGDIEQ